MPFTTTVITGATSGIGKETVIALARKGHAIYMLVRDTVKGEELRDTVIELTKNKNIYVVQCDLADLRSVRDAAELLKSSLMAVNVLINNAGGIFNTYQESKDGNEMTFAVNHLGHFLLTNNLLPALQRGQARIINVSSEAHRMGKPNFRDLKWKNRAYSSFTAYGTAKLCNILFTRALEAKYGPKGITAFALHPGLVNTGFGAQLTGIGKILMWFARPFMVSAEQGAQTTIFLATAPRIDTKSGMYFKNSETHHPSAAATSDESRNQLWDISLKLTEPYLN